MRSNLRAYIRIYIIVCIYIACTMYDFAIRRILPSQPNSRDNFFLVFSRVVQKDNVFFPHYFPNTIYAYFQYNDVRLFDITYSDASIIIFIMCAT